MTVLQSPIQFGDYIMPIGTILKTQQMDSTIENTPMLGLHGEFAPPGYALGATITLQIEVGGGDYNSSGSQLVTLDDVNNEANQLYKRLQEGYQQLLIGTSPARYIMAQKRKFQVDPLEGSGRTHFAITLEFYAQDPRWLSSTLNTQAFAANTSATVTNAGTARSYPVFTITSGTGDLRVKVGAAGGGGTDPGIEIILSGYTMNAGDQIVIDTDPYNRGNAILIYPAGGGAAVNGLYLLGTTGIINQFGTADMFPFLDPGTSYVAFGLGNNTAGSIAWRSAWGL